MYILYFPFTFPFLIISHLFWRKTYGGWNQVMESLSLTLCIKIFSLFLSPKVPHLMQIYGRFRPCYFKVLKDFGLNLFPRPVDIFLLISKQNFSVLEEFYLNFDSFEVYYNSFYKMIAQAVGPCFTI